ncbi:MAG TPA: hypothetical protein VGQ99_05990 [Tepidisphaeraceae bacterium]|nr:hypothetical protein [Tepidisphaeraceae bacterium]
MVKSFRDWMKEGEELYSIALREYETLQSQLEQLETQLSAKKEELNQIAQVVGKPQVDSDLAHIDLPRADITRPDSTRKPAVQIVDRETPGSIPASRNTIAQALTGRGLGR